MYSHLPAHSFMYCVFSQLLLLPQTILVILVANLHRKHSNQQKVFIRNIRFLTKMFYAELKLGERYSYMKNIFLKVFIRLGPRLGRRARI